METANGKVQPVRITIPVVWLSCASCVQRVERALSNQQGVEEASVNFASETTSLAFERFLRV